MRNKMKEDEKNEKIIRGLLKLPANRRCINCNSLGPQYVCADFWTFVCTICSGIHREFTHRVKSISMAKFTSEEIAALQRGGNERAREILFKEWDPQRHNLPDNSNIERLRDFIKHVYVYRRFTGERTTDRRPRMTMDFGEKMMSYIFQDTSRSPSEDSYDRFHSSENTYKYSCSERRSPRYGQKHKRSPARFEIVDDRFRDDEFGRRPRNKRSQEDQRPDGPQKTAIMERTASSSNLGPMKEKSVKLRTVSLGSLIDLAADPEAPPVPASATNDPILGQQVQSQPEMISSSSDARNRTLLALPAQDAPAPPSNATNSVEFQLSQLSAPATGCSGSMSSGCDVAPQTSSNSSDTFQSASPHLSAPAAPSMCNNSTLALQPQHVLPFADSFSFQQFTPAGGASNRQGPAVLSIMQLQESNGALPQSLVPAEAKPSEREELPEPWTSSIAQNAQRPDVVPLERTSQATSKQFQGTSGVLPQLPAPGEAKPSGRKELPEDLFATSYLPAAYPIHRWQAPTHAMGYAMQYPTTALQSVPSFPQESKSTNPFDIGSELTPFHSSMFPSMAPLHEVLSSIATPSAEVCTSSYGTPSPDCAPPQSPSYRSAVPPGVYMLQQAPSSMSPLGHQGIGGFDGKGAGFGSFNGISRGAAGYSQPVTPNSFPYHGGNPFG